MTARIQGLIADFLHKRGFRNYDEFAVDGAQRIQHECKSSNWNSATVKAALANVKTDIFITNRGQRKTEVLTELASKIVDRTATHVTQLSAQASKCRILFLSANPLSTNRLLIDEEFRSVQKNLASSPGSSIVSLETAQAARPDDVLQRLNEVDPHVLHFSGHGSAGDGIALCDDNYGEVFLSAIAIDKLFVAMRGELRLVVLNACYSESQARQIAKHIDCVVGMNTSIRDDAAGVFAASFYRGLAFGKSIRNAFDQGIAAIAMQNVPGHDTPVLLTKKGCNPNKVILVNG